MGIRTIAVFSDPDRGAPFVREADEAIALGASASTDTYLRGDLIIEATELSSRLNLMLDALDPATIERAAKNMEHATTRLSKTVDENESDLREAVKEFRSAAKKLNAIATTNEAEVTSSIKDFGTASRRLSSLSEQLSSTAMSLDRVVQRMDRGEGSLGKAIQDSTLYQEMKETLRNTNELVKDIIAMSGWRDIAEPTVGPSPFTRLNTPFGTPASCRISA